MPASPVTKMACRWPRRALARQTSSSARAVLRPTTLFVSEPGKGAALSSLTGAINWYPRLGKVSIYAGFSGSSPRALRIPRMYCFMTSGLTYLADSANVLLYDFRINVRLGPEGLKNLILRDETFRVFHEITEYVKSLGSEAEALFRAPQAVVHGVEREWLEYLHCLHMLPKSFQSPIMPILDCLVQNGSSTGQFSGMPNSIAFLVALVLAASSPTT